MPASQVATKSPRLTSPTLVMEHQFLSSGIPLVAGCDEVGRGALSGPVTIGIVVVDATTGHAPKGLRDSKLVTPANREQLVPLIQAWAADWSVGHASPQEIDTYGILRAMRLAGERAIAGLRSAPSQVILDGNYNWLDKPAPVVRPASRRRPPVQLMVKADMTCASVAAASVLAKVTRDRLMVELASSFPEYGWEQNKGYSTRQHLDALDRLGPCEHHRRSWKLGTANHDVVGALRSRA